MYLCTQHLSASTHCHFSATDLSKKGDFESGTSTYSIDEPCTRLQRQYMAVIKTICTLFDRCSDKLGSTTASLGSVEDYELAIIKEAAEVKEQFTELIDDFIRISMGTQNSAPDAFRLLMARLRHGMLKAVTALVQTLRGYLEALAGAVRNLAATVRPLLEEIKVRAKCAAAKALAYVTGSSEGGSRIVKDILAKMATLST
ncbi:hypothetical protein BZA05DRAFT_392779 [Tricharina praecox]|uniref:uncharacterized protein n=1 Tax=Tricharina praecox TaxID=43433 RepID=UPI0022210D01|nr:uncharacterized protein BZA05DRAFT_392779 [Tricharina praecox]KAI5854858.1 hypothetical protein BZA05DRAFT_392779 [Tricharina praecox]